MNKKAAYFLQTETRPQSCSVFASGKKALSPVVAVGLLLVLAVTAIVGFQTWFSSYSSSLYTTVEKEDTNSLTSIETIANNKLYITNRDSKNTSIEKITINGNTCFTNTTLDKGTTNFNITASCTSNISGEMDVVITTSDKVISKTIFIKDSLSQTIPITLKFSNGAYKPTDNNYKSSCEEYLNASYYNNESSNYYWISNNNNIIKTYCDMETQNGGWSVLFANGNLSDQEPTDSQTADGCLPRIGSQNEWVCGDVNHTKDFVINATSFSFKEVIFATYTGEFDISAYAYMNKTSSFTIPQSQNFLFNPDNYGLTISGSSADKITCKSNNDMSNLGMRQISSGRGGYDSSEYVFIAQSSGSNRVSITDTDGSHSSTKDLYGFDDLQDGDGCEDSWSPKSDRGFSTFLMVR